ATLEQTLSAAQIKFRLRLLPAVAAQARLRQHRPHLLLKDLPSASHLLRVVLVKRCLRRRRRREDERNSKAQQQRQSGFHVLSRREAIRYVQWRVSCLG